MSKDALIESAISHWAPRMVSNGIMLTDFQEVTASIDRWSDWCAAWCKRASVHEVLGREAMAEGFRLSGAQHLSRAAVYYHFAKFVFVQDVDQMRAAHLKAVECRNLALPHQQPPIRRVEVPYQGKHLAGFLRLPQGVDRPPLLIMVPGLDSAKEELEAYETPFLERGMATLMVDAPIGPHAYALRACQAVAPSSRCWLMRASLWSMTRPARTCSVQPSTKNVDAQPGGPAFAGRISLSRSVAQPGSASALGAEGREFESRRSDHFHASKALSGPFVSLICP